MYDHIDVYEDDFDYSQHTPIELPVGPWDCIAEPASSTKRRTGVTCPT